MRADASRLPALVGVDLGADGYAVVQVDKVLPRDTPPPAQAQQELQQYERAWATAETAAFYDALKDRFNVQIKVPKPREAVPQ